MIARLWSARTSPARARAYLDHFLVHVAPMLADFRGYRGYTLFTHNSEAAVEILVTTFWDSLESIDAFAAPDRDAAVVAPEAAALLTHFDRRVRHYEVADSRFPVPR